MKLKAFFLASLASLSISHTSPSHSMDLSCKNIAIAACATIAGITVSKMAYDYFFVLTDAQEFDQAIKLCEQGEVLINAVDCIYGCQFGIIDCDETHHFTNFNQVPVNASPCARYPFFAYVNSLEKTIDKLINHEDILSSTKIHIFERRMKLIISLAHTSPEESISIKSSIEGYDFVLEEIQNTVQKLKLKRKLLQAIKRSAIAHPQYIIEKQQVRIEELERRLHSYPYATHTTVYAWDQPRSINHVYVHNTHINNTTHTINSSAPEAPVNSTNPSSQQASPDAQSSADNEDRLKKLNPTQKQSAQEDNNLRDRLYDVGDSFNG